MAAGSCGLSGSASSYRCAAPGLGAAAAGSGSGRTVVFVLDGTTDHADAAHLRRGLVEAAGSLRPDDRVSLVIFSAALSVADLSSPGGASQECGNGRGVASSDVLPPLAGPETWRPRLVARLSSFCVPWVEAAASLRAHGATLRGQRVLAPVAQRPRCLGAAVELGVTLATASVDVHGGGARVVVVAVGPGTVGRGSASVEGASDGRGSRGTTAADAAAFFIALAGRAHDAGVVVDVLAGGSRAVGLSALAPLARCTGGVIARGEDVGDLLGARGGALLSRREDGGGEPTATVVDAVAGRGLVLDGLVGPSAPLPEAARRRLGAGPAAVCTGSADPSSGWGIYLSLDERQQNHPSSLASESGLLVQASASWIDPVTGRRMWRVATRSVRTRLGGESLTIDDVAPAVAAGLLGRRVAAAALAAGPGFDEALKAAADELDQWAAGLRRAVGEVTRWKPGLLGLGRQACGWRVPRAAGLLLMAAYHVGRGPLLGGGASHADETALAWEAAVAAGPAAGAALAAPQLWRMTLAGQWVQGSPVDLALLPPSVLVLDAGVSIYIWLGREAAAAAHADRLRRLAHRHAAAIAQGRSVLGPEMRVVTQGDPQARHVASRLVPAHRDPEDAWSEHWPPLGDAPRDIVRALVRREVPPSDLLSFRQWLGEDANSLEIADEMGGEEAAHRLRFSLE